MKNMIELKPHNARKSFYKKAFIKTDNNTRILVSYGTPVACFDDNTDTFKLLTSFISATTNLHINAFRFYLGMNTLTKKQMYKD